jgi:hypothetical protein
MTYHVYSPELGYVQGMSDLLSPIYVVYEGDEAASFWAFCGWMRQMVSLTIRKRNGNEQLIPGCVSDRTSTSCETKAG